MGSAGQSSQGRAPGRPHTDMDLVVTILVLVACTAACGGEPLSEALRRRSVYGVYADDFAAQYEPVGVLRLLSASPLAPLHAPPRAPPRAPYAQHKRAATRAPPRDHYRDRYVYAAEPEYAHSYEDYEQAPSASQLKPSKYSGGSYEEYEAPAPVVVYARPNESGGYSYRRKRPKPQEPEPVIIRVHKYKIIRD